MRLTRFEAAGPPFIPTLIFKMRLAGFEPTTYGFGVAAERVLTLFDSFL